MTKFLFLLIITIIPFQSSIEQEGTKYPIKSGMIKYKIEGRINGEELIYFDNYGELIYIEEIHIGPNDNTNSDIKILCCDTFITINKNKHTAQRQIIDRNTQPINDNMVTPQALYNLGYKLSGNETISGMTCDKYKGDNGKIWIWKNLIFKTELLVLNTLIKKEVIEFVKDPKINANKFNIPDNYTISNNP